MIRVFKVLVILMALSLVSAVAVQPTAAFAGDIPIIQNNSNGDDSGPDTLVLCGDPGGNGEGDPDSVGGGYGAQSSDSDNSGLIGGFISYNCQDLTFEEFVYLILLQFMPTP